VDKGSRCSPSVDEYSASQRVILQELMMWWLIGVHNSADM